MITTCFWMLTHLEPKINDIKVSLERLDRHHAQDIFLTNLHLTLEPSQDHHQNSELWAQSAQVTAQGLKLYFIDGVLNQDEKKIELHAQDAFWPFEQKVIYFFDDLSIDDGDLLMMTSTLSYHFADNVMISNSPTYWKTEDMTMVNHEIKKSADDMKRMFLRS